MSKTIRWMPHLATQVGWACKTSRFLDRAENALTRAQDICLELWPLVESLPVNISHVFHAVPDEMHAAKELFGDLADDERIYQGLFLNQCELVGIARETLKRHRPSEAAINVKRVLSNYCQSDNWEDAVLAVSAVELACTGFCRVAVEQYEEYFSKQADSYSEQLVTSGLEWIRLHARPQTRNALLLLRTLSEISSATQSQIPESAESALNALFALWQCPLDMLDVANNKYPGNTLTSTVSGAGSGTVDNVA